MAKHELCSLEHRFSNSLNAPADALGTIAMTPTPRRPRIVFTPFEFVARERRHLLSEMAQIRGLMPLLMKRRNALRWTPADRAELRGHLKRLSVISPYLMCFVMPGGFALLPALAWWLDRRRQRLSVVHFKPRGSGLS
jgi:hypothetical protein